MAEHNEFPVLARPSLLSIKQQSCPRRLRGQRLGSGIAFSLGTIGSRGAHPDRIALSPDSGAEGR